MNSKINNSQNDQQIKQFVSTLTTDKGCSLKLCSGEEQWQGNLKFNTNNNKYILKFNRKKEN